MSGELPSSGGIGPVSRFDEMFREVKFGKVPSPLGISPVNLLMPSLISSSPCEALRDDGIGPLMLFEESSSFRRFLTLASIITF